jgi:hypothetical protein
MAAGHNRGHFALTAERRFGAPVNLHSVAH